MSDAEKPGVAGAEVGAKAARERLTGTLSDIQSRLNPKTLAREAVSDLRETGSELARDGIDVARRYPLRLAAIAAGLGIFAARGPIKRLFTRRTGQDDEDLSGLSRPRDAGKDRR